MLPSGAVLFYVRTESDLQDIARHCTKKVTHLTNNGSAHMPQILLLCVCVCPAREWLLTCNKLTFILHFKSLDVWTLVILST